MSAETVIISGSLTAGTFGCCFTDVDKGFAARHPFPHTASVLRVSYKHSQDHPACFIGRKRFSSGVIGCLYFTPPQPSMNPGLVA
jgi:hypothetical protein